MAHDPYLRRKKKGAAADFWHTLRIGLVIFIFLLVLLPMLLD